MAQIDINDPIWDGVRDRLIAIGEQRATKKERDRIARNLLMEGQSKDLVSQCTSLSTEEVDEIARSLGYGD